MPLGLGISCKAFLLFLKKFSGDLFFDVVCLFSIYVFMGQTDGKLSELRHYIQNRKGLGSNPASAWLWRQTISNSVITIGLVTLSLNSGVVNSLVKIFNMNMNSHVKILIWQLEEGKFGWTGWKMGRGKVYISCNYSCAIYSLVNILLFKLKYLQYSYSECLNLNHEKTK